MFTIKSPLEYFPISVGDYKLSYDKKNNQYLLFEKDYSWMGYDQNSYWQSTEFYIELSKAKGVCITTGLGLGILQTSLTLKEDVTKIIVYEKSLDVIEIFHRLVKYNNFDISKIEIRHGDADNFSGQTCDCLFLDHFSSEPESHVVNVVRNLSYNNRANLVWYWPAGHHFIKFIIKNQIDITPDSYQLWKNYTKISNLPDTFEKIVFDYFVELKEIYKNSKTGIFGGELFALEERNKLLKARKKFKSNEESK
jgi:hypothetical protein